MKIRSSFTLLIALSLAAHAQEVATSFTATAAFPKYVSADIEFRDSTGVKWPNFFYGKPAGDGGVIDLNPTNPSASFTLVCDKMAQERGDQSRRVIGELCPPEKPPAVILTVTGIGPLMVAVAGGKDKNKPATTAELIGTLELAGRKLPVKALTSFRVHDGKGDEKNAALMLDGKFTVKASTLGLKTLAPTADIEVRFGLTAYPPEVVASGGKKK